MTQKNTSGATSSKNFFCAIKAFRRIATRYEKTDKCFAAMINIDAIVLWTR
jgi:transposase